mgnify:CR=1 FL=1
MSRRGSTRSSTTPFKTNMQVQSMLSFKFSATKLKKPRRTSHTLLNSRRVKEVPIQILPFTSTRSEENALKRISLRKKMSPPKRSKKTRKNEDLN